MTVVPVIPYAVDPPRVVLTPNGAAGPAASISHAERSRRTAELLVAAVSTEDDDERGRLRDAVVVLNCRVADAVAARYRDRGVPAEDLQQAAYEGLVKAVQRYDPSHADDLLTFAVPTIRGEVRRYFRDRAWMVKPPRRLQELQGRTNAALDHLGESLGREPTDAEVCDYLGIDAEEYTELRLAFGCFHPPSLDRPVSDTEDSASLGDLLADERDDRDAAEARCLLAPALARLGERDRRILRLRFVEEWTQREIGDEFELTQTQVSRLLGRILRDLRGVIEPETAGSRRPARLAASA